MSWPSTDPGASRTAGLHWPAVFAAAARLALLRRPASAVPAADIAHFCLLGLGFLLAGMVLDHRLIEAPRWFNGWALSERSLPLLVGLAGAAVVASLLQRRHRAIGFALVLGLALLPGMLGWIWLQQRYPLPSPWNMLPLLYLSLLAARAVAWLQAAAHPLRCIAATLVLAAVMIGLWRWAPDTPWWWQPEDETIAAVDAEPPVFHPEPVWAAQPALLAEHLAALDAQRPGVIDLFVLGVAGDGNESVFRNEVEYLHRLAAQRLGAAGRSLALVNHPESVTLRPIASVTNLGAALNGLGARMDVDEDILLLFLTSHGSEDHELLLSLDPLPLDALRPDTLRGLLDEAGIRWRVLVVSACYSGGYIDALSDPQTLVITASRADRPSFGCGVQSEITWFGEALLAEALNTTIDFEAAFELARDAVRRREKAEEERPSHPQIVVGERIGERLALWREGIADGPAVPFAPVR